MNYKLYLDSSDIYLSVGISLDGKLIYSYQKDCFKRQSEFMMSEIDKALKACSISMKDISEAVIGIGPGSYTGVRISLAIAKTLYAIRNIKVTPLSSLQIMGDYGESYIALMNARSNRSYIGVYSDGKTLIEDQVLSNDEAKKLIEDYLKKDYHLRGDAAYLGLESERPSLVSGLFTNGEHQESYEIVDKLTPRYLKENY